ncbi:MAG: Holliday junction resolvase RuvX, partial [Anaerolineae bacterium]|nr:Holliday junction resolvase RuvX [Anaerolineae bacterium]
MIGKFLGIDHGLARIGVAVSDAMGVSARELLVIHRRSKQEDFTQINQLAAAENVIAVVVGIPHNEAPEGVHTQADTVRNWIANFGETTSLPIIEWDEQLTSEDAKKLAKMQKRSVRDPIDDLAARLILQSYLDALHDG